jgi:enoyl-CoA hydratase/carnithine racemase
MLSKVVPDGRLEAECRRLAERICLMPPRAVQLTKRSLNKLEEFQGMLQALEHHFVVHQLGHVTSEAEEWGAAAKQAREAGGGFRAWLDFRDGPFNEQATKEY